jgi:hypothetical protein
MEPSGLSFVTPEAQDCRCFAAPLSLSIGLVLALSTTGVVALNARAILQREVAGYRSAIRTSFFGSTKLAGVAGQSAGRTGRCGSRCAPSACARGGGTAIGFSCDDVLRDFADQEWDGPSTHPRGPAGNGIFVGNRTVTSQRSQRRGTAHPHRLEIAFARGFSARYGGRQYIRIARFAFPSLGDRGAKSDKERRPRQLLVNHGSRRHKATPPLSLASARLTEGKW